MRVTVHSGERGRVCVHFLSRLTSGPDPEVVVMTGSVSLHMHPRVSGRVYGL